MDVARLRSGICIAALLGFLPLGCAESVTRTFGNPPPADGPDAGKADAPHGDGEDAATEASVPGPDGAPPDAATDGNGDCITTNTFSGQQFGGMTYTNWYFPSPKLTSVTTRLCFENALPDYPGIYFQTYDAGINGHGTYHGLVISTADGRIALFSRFGTTDMADIRVAPDGGFFEIGTYEGPFASVRRAYPFTTGCHDVRVQRADADGEQDWFEMHVKPVNEATWLYVGAIRFPRATPGTPATISNGGGSWTEVYSSIWSVFAIPYVHVSYWALGNGSEEAAYAISDYSERPNSTVWYAPEESRVHHEFGVYTPRCHPPGMLF